MDEQTGETVTQLRQQLEEKSRRLEELEEAIFEAVGQRLSTSGTTLTALEQFELDLKERELIDNERDEELRLLQEVNSLILNTISRNHSEFDQSLQLRSILIQLKLKASIISYT